MSYRTGLRRAAPWWLAALAALAALLLVACGGGVGTGGTGSFASGPITGFGSIVVDGVHFDESAARVEADDGSGRDRSELHLGTMVEIDSGEIRHFAATASRVRIASALIGRVESVLADGLVVNGLSVRVDAGTVIDDGFAGGLAGVAIGRVVEVHGFVAATEVAATRIEPADGATAFKFRGMVVSLDTQAGTFDLGGQHFAYNGAVSGVAELRDGAFVRVVVDTQRDAQGHWVVVAVGSTGPGNIDRDQAKAHGVILSFTSNASLVVGGMVVDASAAQIVNGPLAAGLRVEVDGRLTAGVLVASHVEVRVGGPPADIEMRGPISSVDTATQTFRIGGRKERVGYARPDIAFANGTAADLAPGRRVLAVGRLSADGTIVEATLVRFDN